MARAGVASRRGADELIKAGRVQVNDQPGQLNTEVSDSDSVTVNSDQVQKQNLRYILLNKPRNTVTTLSDPEGRSTVIEILNIKERVVPVGRLDTNTTGVLLLTNDGYLTHKLMHPSFEFDKVYEAEVEGQITDGKMRKLEQGIQLEDGTTAPAKARILEGTTLSKGRTLIELTIHEGKKHQVKRMLEAVDLPVRRLHRSKYAGLKADGLRPGQWRDLTKDEIGRLKQA